MRRAHEEVDDEPLAKRARLESAAFNVWTTPCPVPLLLYDR